MILTSNELLAYKWKVFLPKFQCLWFGILGSVGLGLQKLGVKSYTNLFSSHFGKSFKCIITSSYLNENYVIPNCYCKG